MTPAERLRKNQRMLDKAIRELDQTRVKLEKQEKERTDGRLQDPGQGSCANEAVHREVLLHAESVAEDLPPTPGLSFPITWRDGLIEY